MSSTGQRKVLAEPGDDVILRSSDGLQAAEAAEVVECMFLAHAVAYETADQPDVSPSRDLHNRELTSKHSSSLASL